MNAWQFMGDHPVLTIFLAIIACLAVDSIFTSIAIAIAHRGRK